METLSSYDIAVISTMMEHYFFGHLNTAEDLIIKSAGTALALKLNRMLKELEPEDDDRLSSTDNIFVHLDALSEAIEIKLQKSKDWNTIIDIRSQQN